MLPVRDVIPTRTPPAVTVALIAASVLASPASGEGVPAVAIDLLCLWIFGGAVEDRIGHARFAAFYVLCGASAAATLSITGSPVTVPLGSAVAGVMGAYFLLFPKSRVLALIPFPPIVIEIPAVALPGVWLIFQALDDIGTLRPLATSTVGCITGILLSRLLRRPERARVDWWSN